MTHDAPLAQNGHLNRFASVGRLFVTTGAFFARLPIDDDDVLAAFASRVTPY